MKKQIFLALVFVSSLSGSALAIQSPGKTAGFNRYETSRYFAKGQHSLENLAPRHVTGANLKNPDANSDSTSFSILKVVNRGKTSPQDWFVQEGAPAPAADTVRETAKTVPQPELSTSLANSLPPQTEPALDSQLQRPVADSPLKPMESSVDQHAFVPKVGQQLAPVASLGEQVSEDAEQVQFIQDSSKPEFRYISNETTASQAGIVIGHQEIVPPLKAVAKPTPDLLAPAVSPQGSGPKVDYVPAQTREPVQTQTVPTPEQSLDASPDVDPNAFGNAGNYVVPQEQQQLSPYEQRLAIDQIADQRMQDRGDHFSPGGEPFAANTSPGNPRLFGVSEEECCDKWEGFCNCRGLKESCGHLGCKGLRSKDNCDGVGCKENFLEKRQRCNGSSCGQSSGCSDGCGAQTGFRIINGR